MNTPFFKYGLFEEEISPVVAFVIGIGFGYFLERAGFGSAKKLTAQFYFTDLAVFKVMFTAIVTAMLGVYYLGVLGLLDLSLVYITPTFLIPQIIGGLLLGFGFVIGGYCPGTSCVSVSNGKIDALVFLFGVLSGIFVFGEIFPMIKDFYYSSNMGQITLPEILHLPYGLVVFLVILIAIGGFVGAEFLENRINRKKE